jgi:hypothetical protein
MESDKKHKTAFRRYLEASEEEKDCKDPCLKNNKSDRFCLECANEIINPLILAKHRRK